MNIKTYSISDFSPLGTVDYYVGDFETGYAPDPLIYPHIHKHYVLIWVASGKGRQNIDFQEFEILPDTLYFISPSQIHFLDDWESIKGKYLVFTEDILNRLEMETTILTEIKYFDELYFRSSLSLMADEKDVLIKLFDVLAFEQKSRNLSKNSALILYLILNKVRVFAEKRRTQNRYQGSGLQLFKEFIQLLEEYYNTSHKVNHYARQLNTTPHKLNKVVNEFGKTSTSQYIINRKIQEAKRLLAFTDKTISEIAFQLGFNDSSYFSRTYRNTTSLSPKIFREEAYEKYRK